MQDKYPTIVSLDPDKTCLEELEFSSTMGTGSWSFVTSWAKECAASHPKCHRICKTGFPHANFEMIGHAVAPINLQKTTDSL